MILILEPIIILMIVVVSVILVIMFKDDWTWRNMIRAATFISLQKDPSGLVNNLTPKDHSRNFRHPLKWTYRSMYPALYELEKAKNG